MRTILIVSIWVVFGAICFKMARKKIRNTTHWFFLGFFFGLLAVIVLYFLKPLGSITQDILIQRDPFPFLKNDKNYWYYLDIQKKQIGPMSIKKIFDNYLEAKISENTFVWNDTMGDWIRLKETSIFSKFQKKITE